MRWSPPPAARSRIPRAQRCISGWDAKDFIVPEFIAWGDPSGGAPEVILRKVLLERRPAGVGVLEEARGVGGKGVAVVLSGRTDRAAGPSPPRTAGCPHTSRRAPDRPDRSRRTGARRFPDGRQRRRGCPRCGSARPRRPRGASKSGRPWTGQGIGEIGDGVEPLDRKPRIAVHHHPFGGRGAGRQIEVGDRMPAQGEKGYSGAAAISFLPLCRHCLYWYHR